ncbi:MAG: hypothetical protein IKB65_09910 [Ruminiclostridium sp.]|nr:hypothetical protein [Ruminiclostridium sp.]
MSEANRTQEVLGSITPSLEGAPSTLTHENRHKSVISEPRTQTTAREEGSPSKP